MQLRSPVSINQWMLWFMGADVSHCCALGGLAAQKCAKQTANRRGKPFWVFFLTSKTKIQQK